MKKVFISVPMRGRTDEDILKSINQMHKIAEGIFNQELEIIHNFCTSEAPENCIQPIYYLGYAIQKMSEADYFIGIEDTRFGIFSDDKDKFKGCVIEEAVADEYGIKSYLVDIKLVAPDVCNKKGDDDDE